MSELEPIVSNPSLKKSQHTEPQAEVSIANEPLWLLVELASELSSALDLNTLRSILGYKLRWIFNFDRCTLAVCPESTDSEYLLFEIANSSKDTCIPPQKIPLNQGWPGRILTEAKPYFLADLTQLPPQVTQPENPLIGIHPKACSLMLLPLKVKERTIGSLNFSSNTLGTYSIGSWHLANLVATQIGGQLNSILIHQQNCITINVLEKLQAQLERDIELREQRIAQLEEQVRDFKKLNQVRNKFLSSVSYQIHTPNAFKPETPNWQCVHTLTKHSQWVEAVAISANGQFLASGHGDSTINLWHLSSRELLRAFRSSKGVGSVALSSDGQILASGNHDNTIDLWHSGTGELLHTLVGHLERISSVAISPNKQTLASLSGHGRIDLWHLGTGKLIRTLKHSEYHSGWIEAMAISRDGETLASESYDNTIDLWHLGTGELLCNLKSSKAVSSVALSPDGQILASGSHDSTIDLWCLATGKLLCTFIGHSGAVYAVALSPDGQTLASGSHDQTIKIWHLGTGELLQTLTGHSGAVYAVALSPDGQTLASSSHDQTIKIWRLPS